MEKLKVCKILSTIGLKGEVKVYTTSSFKEIRYKKNNELFYIENDKENVLTVSSFRNKEGNIDVLTFKEIKTVEDATKILGKELFVEKDESILNDEEYFYSDLISSKVFDEDHNELGVVQGIDEFTANLSLRLKLNSSKKIIYIPFNDVFVKNVDINKKEITIHVIEGLLDL